LLVRWPRATLLAMSEKQRFPEANGEALGGTSEVSGGRWLTVAEVADLIDMSERSARDWVKRHQLPVNDARPVRVAEDAVHKQLAREHRPFRNPPEASGDPAGGISEAPGGGEPIEATYRVTPAAIEQAVSRTSAQYMTDLRTMLAEVGKVYEGQLAAQDAALAAKDQTLAMQIATLAAQDETIAELRRRAEVAEAERDRLQAAHAAHEAPSAMELRGATGKPPPACGRA